MAASPDSQLAAACRDLEDRVVAGLTQILRSRQGRFVSTDVLYSELKQLLEGITAPANRESSRRLSETCLIRHIRLRSWGIEDEFRHLRQRFSNRHSVQVFTQLLKFQTSQT